MRDVVGRSLILKPSSTSWCESSLSSSCDALAVKPTMSPFNLKSGKLFVALLLVSILLYLFKVDAVRPTAL